MGPLRFELRSIAPEANSNNTFSHVDYDKLNEFMAFRKIEGFNNKWIYIIKQFITYYLNYMNWNANKKRTLEYLNKLQNQRSSTTYGKKVYRIRKFPIFLQLD
jgi:hypothetical protein